MKIQVTQTLPNGQVVQQVLSKDGAEVLKIQVQPGAKISFNVEGAKPADAANANAKGKAGNIKKVGNNLVLESDGEALVEVTDFYTTAGASVGDVGWNYAAQDAAAASVTPEAQALSSEAAASEPGALSSSVVPGLLAVGGVAAVAGSGSAATVAVSNVVSGAIVAGPVIAGHGLSVVMYKADGTTALGTAVVDAAGQFSLDVGSYTGVIIAKVLDAGVGNDYADEASGRDVDLGAQLMAVGVMTGGALKLNINPLTAIAAQKAGLLSDGSGSVASTTAATEANAAVAKAFGLADVTQTDPDTSNDSVAGVNAIGAVLAALSGLDAQNGNAQTTINNFVAGITQTGAVGVLTASAQTAALQGAAIADPAGTLGLVNALSDAMSAAVTTTGFTIGDVATDNVIKPADGLATTTTITGTVATGTLLADLDLKIGGVASANNAGFVLTGTTWTYTLSASDVTALTTGTDGALAIELTVAGVTKGQRMVLKDMTDDAPSAVTFLNPVTSILENAVNTSGTKVADINIADMDGYVGVAPTVSDATNFEVRTVSGKYELWLKSSASLDYETVAGQALSTTVTAGGTTSQALTLAIANVNEAPTAVGTVTAQPAVNGQAYNLDVHTYFADVDTSAPNNTLTYSATGLPTGVTINPTTGVISGTATADRTASSVVVTATDGGSLSITQSFNLAVVSAPAVSSFTVADSTGTTTLGKSGEALSFVVTLSEAVITTAGLTAHFSVNGQDVTATSAAVTGANTITFTGASVPGTGNGTAITLTSLAADSGTIRGNVSSQDMVVPAAGAIAYSGYTVDNTAPTIIAATVSGTDSADVAKSGTLAAGDKIVVTLTIDDSTAAVTGNPTLSILLNGSPKTATFVSKTGASLVFSYTVLQGDNNPGSITLGSLTQSAGVNSVDDAAGNLMVLPTGITVSGSVAVDASALATTAAITTVTDNVGVNTGTDAAIAGYQNTSTDDADLLVKGTISTTLTGTQVLAVYDGITRKGTATVDNVANTWTFQTGALANGAHGLTVRVEDTSTNPQQNGSYSSAFNFNVESAGITLTNITSDSGTTVGAIAQRGIAADTTPTLGGVLGAPLLAGEKVGVYQNGTRVADASMASDGVTWSYTPGTALTAGKYAYVVKVDDGTSANVRMEMPATLSGALSAALTAGQKIGIYRTIASVEIRLGDATVGSDGLSWTYTPSAAAGAATWDVRVDDGTSHGGANSVATYDLGRVIIVDDGTPPTQTPSITSVTDNVTTNASVQGALATGTSTDDTTLALVGTLDTGLVNGQVLVIYKTVSGITTKLGNAAVIGADWTYSTPALSAGNHTLKAVVEGGGSGVQGTPATFDVKVQTLASTGVLDDVGLATGTVAASATTDDARPTLTGTLGVALGSNEEIGIYDGTTYLGAAAVITASNGTLTWSYTPGSDLSLANHTLKAAVQATNNTDIANARVVTAGNTFTVAGPTAPLAKVSDITVADDVASNTFTGNLANNTSTNDTQLKLTIALDETGGVINTAAGDVVEVFDGATKLGNAVLNGANWELTTGVLPTGTHSFTAKVTNTSSGLSSTSTATAMNIAENGFSSVALSVNTGAIATDGGARYIMMRRNGGEARLWELEVISNGTNIALNKATTSSVGSIPGFVDGLYTQGGAFWDAGDQWVQIDLGAVYSIDSLVYTPTTMGGNRTNNFMFYGSWESMSSSTQAQLNAGATAVGAKVVTLGGPTPASATATTYTPNLGSPANVIIDDTPTISGVLTTALLAGEKVAVYKNGTYAGDATTEADGKTWSYTSPALTVGSTYTFGAKVTNGISGVEGTEVRLDAAITANTMSSFKVIAAPTVSTTVATLTVSDDLVSNTSTGEVVTGTSTNDTTPTYTVTLSGALTGNQKVEFSVDGAVVSTGAALTYTPSTAQAAGAHTVSARVIDATTFVASAPQTATYQLQGASYLVVGSDTGQVTEDMSRYIMMRRTGGEARLWELEVFSNGTNIALNKATTSSIGSVPGFVDGLYAQGAAFWDAGDQWVQIDLGAAYRIDTIKYTPTNMGGSRTNDFMFYGSRESMSSSTQAQLNAGATAVGAKVVTLGGPTPASATATTYAVGALNVMADDLTPALSGALSASLGVGEALAVFVDGVEQIGASFVTTGLNWSVTLPAQTAGTKALEVRVVDSSAHATVKAVLGTMNVTLIDPSVVSKTISTFVVTDDVGTQQSALATGSSTDDNLLVFSGTVSAALGGSEVVRIYDNGTLLGNATVGNLGFSFTPTSTAAVGAHSFTARIENTASGAQGTASTALATSINAIAVTSYNTTNANVNDGMVRYIKVQNTTGANMTLGEVEVYSNGVNIARSGTVSVANGNAQLVNGITSSTTDGYVSGSWVQLDLGGFYKVDSVKLYSQGTNTPTGTNNLTVFAAKTDLSTLSYSTLAANTSEVFNLGTTSGATTAAFSQSFNGPSVSIGSITPTLSGTLATALLAGEKLMVQIDSGTAVDITSSLSGLGWSYTVSGQTAGAHTFKVSIQDSGNTQTRVLRSETINLLDPAAPNVTIATIKATDDVALATLGTGDLTASGSTDDTTPTLSGTLSAALGAGQAVQVWDTYKGVATLLGTATISGAGSTDWSFTPGAVLSAGVHSLSVKAVNLASGAAAAPQTLSLAVGALGSIGVVADIGLVSSNNGTLTTVDTTPTLTGTLAGAPQAGEQVAVYIGGVFKGVATVSTTAGGSSWSYTPTALSIGSYDVRVQVENTSTHATFALQTGTVQVLGATPSATVSSILVTDAVGSTSTGFASYTAGDFTGTVAAGTSTNDTKPVVSGTLSTPLAGGEVVQVFDGTTYLGNATVAGSTWTYSVPNALSLGSHTLSARVTNPASGNSSTSVVGNSSVTVVENSLSVPVFSTNGGALVGGPAVRYVMVRQDNTVNQGMLIGEVEIYANGVNVARNAGVTASMKPGDTYYQSFGLSGLIDGVTPVGGNYTGGFAGDGGTDAWVQIDLGAFYYIDSVKLISMGPSGSGTLNHLTVLSSATDMASRSYTALLADGQVRNLGTTSGVPVNVSSSTTLTTSPLPLSTADDTPTLSGTLGAALGTGEKLMLQVDIGAAVDITSSLSGLGWTYTPGSTLSTGNHSFKVQVVRADSTVVMAQTQAINVLSSTPAAGVSTLVVTDAVGTSSTGGYANGDRTGTVSANTSLNDSKPVISGTLGAALAQGEVVQVFDGLTLLGQATTNGTIWSYTPTTALAVGSHSLNAKVTNLSSGISNSTVATQTLLVNSLTVGGLTALNGSGAADGVTTGGIRYVLLRKESADSNVFRISEVEVLVGGVNVALNKAVTVSDPQYDYDGSPKFLTDGANPNSPYIPSGSTVSTGAWVLVDLGQTYASVDSVRVTGSGGGTSVNVYASSQNISAYSNAQLNAGTAGATYLGTATSGTMTFAAPSSTYISTTDTTPQLSGTLAAGLGSGERLAIYVDGSYMGDATVAAGSNTWTYTTTALTVGNHAVKVQLETSDGNTVILSQSMSFNVATATTPTAVVNGSITVTDDVGAASAGGHTGGDAIGAIATGTSSDDTLPALSGTLSAALSSGQVVRVYDTINSVSTYLGNATVSGTSWTFQTANALSAGSHALSAAVYTADGKLHSTSTATGGSLVVNSLGISSVTADTVGTAAVGGVRYVMVRDTWLSRGLSLAELEVFDTSGTNVAAGKYATAFSATSLTSALQATSKGYVGVTDGISTAPTLNNTNAQSRNDWSYSSTASGGDRWVQVDLGGYYNLSKVNFYGIAEKYAGLDQAYVYASANDMSGQTVAALQAGAAGAVTLNTANPLGHTDGKQTVMVNAQAAITTDDTTPVINGTLGAALGTNERVAVYVDGVYKGNANVSGSGSNIIWTATLPTQGLGSHTVTVQIEDSSSSIVKMAQTQTINVIASAAPTTVVNTLTVSDDLGATSLYGYSNGDGTGVLRTNSNTDDTTPTISGTLSAVLGSGDVVQVYGGAAGTTLLGLATVNGTNWTYTPQADLAVGSYQFSAKVTNLVSNQSSTSTAAAVTTVVNSLSAPAPTVDSGVKMVDTGAAATSQVRYVMVAKTADGTAFDINELLVMSGGVNVAATVTNNAAIDGKYSRSAYGTGAAFSTGDGVLETSMGYGTDAKTVTAGKLLWVQVDLGGLYAVDSITLKGADTAGMSVFASAHSMQAMAGNTTALDTLKQTTAAYATAAGNVATLAELNANPNVMAWGTVPNATAGVASQTTFTASTITDTTPTISGTLGVALGSADVLMAYVDGATTGVQVTPSGLNWTYTPTLTTLGSHTVKVQIEDSSTHTVRMAQTQSFTLTELATQSVSTIGAAVDGAGNGGVQGMLSAALQAGQQVGVYDGSVLLGYASVTPGSASFSYSFTGMGLGAHNLTAKVVNYDGSLGSGAVGTTSVTVAGSTPTQRMSFTAEDSSGREIVANSGNAAVAASADSTMGNVTADTTPTFVGRLSSVLGSGETIEAYADGVLLTGGTLAVAGLNWTYTAPVLTEGNHDITFHVKTAGGVTGLDTSAFRVNVDAVVANKATLDYVIDDSINGGAAGLLSNGATTDDGAVTLVGHLDFAQAGRVLVYDNGSTLVTQFDVGATSTWSTTVALGSGAHSLTAKFQNADSVLQTAAATAFTLTEGTESLVTTTTVSGGVTSLAAMHDHQVLDLTRVANAGVDKVDLGTFGGNYLKLSVADVLQADANLFTTAGSWNFSNANDNTNAATYHQFMVAGASSSQSFGLVNGAQNLYVQGLNKNVADSYVDLTSGTSKVELALNSLDANWALTGTASKAGATYNVYTSAADTAQLLVDQRLEYHTVL